MSNKKCKICGKGGFFNNREIEELPVTIWGKVIELRRPY